jgi:lipopolysaccharide biosynthesis glycosyltransferase
MSKNLVWTVNINNHMSSNARESISDAADRWGCDYLEIRTIFDTRLYPSFAKICSFEKIEGYERAVYFDSDMLIHIDTPNPFEVFSDESKFYATLDIHPHRYKIDDEIWSNVKNDNQEYYYNILEQQFGWNISKEIFLDNFFNSGFFLYSSKRHKSIFKAISQALPLIDGREVFSFSAHYEQALFNYIVQGMRPNDLTIVDESWNYLEPPINEPKMNSYVWHFTGYNFWKIKDSIKDYDWRLK